MGGNAKEYEGMLGDGGDIKTAECTRLGWSGTPLELIILMVIDGYNNDKTHWILNPNLCKVGINFKAHKKHHNIF